MCQILIVVLAVPFYLNNLYIPLLLYIYLFLEILIQNQYGFSNKGTSVLVGEYIVQLPYRYWI